MTGIPNILAFGLGSPWLLGGLALGAIPVIIHLLHKRRFQETQWAAMKFLIEAAKKNSRRLRLEQLILLAVRILILCLISLAMAQPFVETMGAFFQADLPTHRIIVVDVSMSMGHQRAEQSRVDKAKEIAQQIISASIRGDAMNLVIIGGSEPRMIIREPAFQSSQVSKELELLDLTHGHGDVIPTLKSVSELTKMVPEISRKEVTIISDFQSENWSPEFQAQRTEIRNLLKSISEDCSLHCIDVGIAGNQNVGITDLSSNESFIATGQVTSITATVKNFGSTPLTDQLVELYADDRLVEPKRINLPARAEVPLDFTVRFSDSGEHHLELRLEDDTLMQDNRRWMAIPVKDELQVLLINGQNSGRSEDTATYYLERALAPSTRDTPWQGFIRPVIVNEGELPSLNLSQYDCVFLCNVALLTEREADMLIAFVQGGGGLIISLGDQVQAENYNQRLFRDGEGILPAKLGDRVGATLEADVTDPQLFYFNTGNLEHPIVREFQGNSGTGLERTLTFQYFKADADSKAGTRTAISFDSGDPAIVDSPFGQGRTILVTTSVDRKWGTWTTSASVFVPLMVEIVQYSVSGHWRERQLEVGQPLTQVFPNRAFDLSVMITTPDDKQAAVRVTEMDGVSSIAFEDTYQTGLHELSLGPPLNRNELFAVNIDNRESDLTKLDEAGLSQELLAGIEFDYSTDWKRRNSGDATIASERGGLTRWLLFAAFGLLFVEQLMAWRFPLGFGLLYCLVAFGFARQAFWYGTFIGWAVTILALAGLVLLISRQSAKVT